MKELTQLESLKLSLEYSISKKHQKSLLERIAELEGGTVEKTIKRKVRKEKKVIQESFL